VKVNAKYKVWLRGLTSINKRNKTYCKRN